MQCFLRNPIQSLFNWFIFSFFPIISFTLIWDSYPNSRWVIHLLFFKLSILIWCMNSHSNSNILTFLFWESSVIQISKFSFVTQWNLYCGMTHLQFFRICSTHVLFCFPLSFLKYSELKKVISCKSYDQDEKTKSFNKLHSGDWFIKVRRKFFNFHIQTSKLYFMMP